jgi:trehalose 6-phosphate synthase/phosphatase
MAEEEQSQPLVVVSNRLPVTVRRSHGALQVERSSGGLVTAMGPAMKRRGGMWVGWPGAHLRPDEERCLQDESAGYALVPVNLSETEVRRYYRGFSNQTLWPLFHSLLERTELDRRNWEVYEAVNARFAEVVDEKAGPDDLIWIHDYQLMRCADHLRERRPDARIAFFLHIPFPPFDLYRVLPWYRELLRGLLAADLVGFHSDGYVTNFLDCVERLLGERVDRSTGRVEHGSRTVEVADFPLGIDYGRFEALATTSPRALHGPERVVLGVDRLDYTKGIPERIRAFERLLEEHKEYREKVVLLQIAVPSRSQVSEYQKLKREIDELVGHVNGRFGTSSWTPIRYLYRSISQERLVALYRDSDVALVTPLRDGMNLVAKEYVASQADEPGVLVLSRMAGAAERMHEALLVNPFNVDSVVAALHRALGMPREDRLARLLALQRRERRNDVHHWLDTFLRAVTAPRHALRPVTSADFESWLGEFLDGWRAVLFLDYDGTLSNIVAHPDRAVMSKGMREALTRCVAREDLDVGIVSGRALEDVRKRVDFDHEVLYAGNHGLEIEGPGIERFVHPDTQHYTDRAAEIARRLASIDLPGTWVEEKGVSLTFHFRETPDECHPEAASRAREIISSMGFQPRDAHCAVEARPPIGWDKGQAVLHVLRERYGADWSERLRVIYVGDDDTDEDAFQALVGLGATFRVGDASRPTRARRRLADVDAVERMLRWLASRPSTP